MFTELDPTLLVILGGTIMGLIQAVKPFIPEKYVLVALGAFSTVLGLIVTTTMETVGIGGFLVQAIANTYFIVIAASGPYSIAKTALKTEENPKGI